MRRPGLDGSVAVYLLIDLPSWIVVAMVIAALLAIAFAGLLIVRRVVPLSLLREHNDVAGFIFAVVGVIYAVILAFVAVAVWTDFEDSQRAIDVEAASIAQLYRNAQAFPPHQRDPVQAAVVDYGRSIVDDEWPRMADGSSGSASQATTQAMADIWSTLQAIEPGDGARSVWYQAAVTTLNDITVAREIRLRDAEERIPDVLMAELVLGAAITIAYSYLYGVRNRYGQFAMTAALAGIIAITIGLIVVLDAPFHGDTSITAQPIIQALDEMTQAPTGP